MKSYIMMDEGTGSMSGSVWEQMLIDHYSGKKAITFHTHYIPIQWVDAKDWGTDIGKQNLKEAYLDYEITKTTDEGNDNG